MQITPPPFRPDGPAVMLGGSSEAAARRAARIADGFMPSVPVVWEFYRDEVIKLGRTDPGPNPTGKNRIVALAEDADAGWAAMESCFLHENNAYGVWQAQDDVASPYHSVSSGGRAGQRMVRNASRISVTKRSGCSNAAKCPPRSSSLK